VALDTVLNLIWLGIGATALVLLGVSEFRHRPSQPSWIVRRVLAVFFVAVSLFPCVSASDDLFSFTFLQSHLGKTGGMGTTTTPPEDAKEKANLHLARLLQSLDHLQIAGIYALAVVFFCFAFVLAPGIAAPNRGMLCRAGRSPPAASLIR
jgi:hypothetical protein